MTIHIKNQFGRSLTVPHHSTIGNASLRECLPSLGCYENTSELNRMQLTYLSFNCFV